MYAPKSFAMLESAANLMPHLEFFFLDIEGCKPRVEYSNACILSLQDIGISGSDFHQLKRKYNVIEFATAVKPFLLKALLRKGFKTVTYLDPDILVIGTINEVFRIANLHEVVVAPHRLTPCTNSNSSFEVTLNRVGIFNLGFIAVSQNSFRLLDWWMEKTNHYASLNWFRGQFTDQKWVDHFPAYFKTFIIKNPGYNLACWNIDERPLKLTKTGVILANDEPLRFVHFSQGSHRLESPSTMRLWGSLNKEDFEVISFLAKKYTSNIASVEHRISWSTPREIRLKLAKPKFRFNTLDALDAGIREDWRQLRDKLSKH
jgi:hypothetical protein